MTGFRQILPSVLIMPLVLGLSACPALAGYSLGDAVNYGVLANPGTGNFQLTSDTHITGNIGVLSSNMTSTGTNNNIQFSGAIVSGRLDLQGSHTNSIGGTATGGVFAGVSDVLTAYNTLQSLSSTEAAQPGTTIVYSGTGGTTLVASTGTPDSNGDNVFTTTATALSGGTGGLQGTLTVNGTASLYVVIDITGSGNFSWNQQVLLTGGITADHVLFNFTGTGAMQVSGAHGGVLNGDILALGYSMNMDNVTVDGRVFGGAGQNFQLVSGFTLNQPVNVPEPSSVALLGLGGLAGTAARLRRRWRRPGA
jgi:hypothetical protein